MHKKLFLVFFLMFFSGLAFCQEELTKLSTGYEKNISPEPAEVEMVLIPEGSFLMGNTPEYINALRLRLSTEKVMKRGWFDDEIPQHNYYLPAYYIDRYEVTNKQYRKFMQATKYPRPAFFDDPMLNGDDQPVVGVNWADADAYCWWAKKRLPTEAEWEKAARGTDGKIFPWGNKWLTEYTNSIESGLQKTAPVGRYTWGASEYGVMDMAGNVWEWCSDWYDRYIYRFSSKNRKPRYSRHGHRVIRGGSYLDSSFELRSTYRFRFKQQYNFINIGFRCVKAP